MNLVKFTCGTLLLAMSLAGQTQPPTIAAVANFNGGNKFSPAAYAFLFGTNFGATPKVFVGATPCTMFYVTDTYFSFQIPAGASVGPSTITVQTGAGTSAPFSFTISPTSPVIATTTLKPPLSYFFDLTPFYTPISTPAPGQRVYMEVDGVGPTRPPIPPQILMDGKDVPVLATTTFKAFIGAVNSALGDMPAFTIQIPNLPGGPHTLEVVAGAASTGPLQFTILARGLFTSQTGLSFNAVQGGPPIPNQSFAVLSGQGTLNFSLSTSTVSGGNWLSATPSTGTSTVSTAGAPIQVQANPSGLALGTYYGTVTIASPDVPNSPQTVTVVLNVSAKVGPSVSKTGVILVAAAGTNPPGQTITAFNPTVGTISYTSNVQSATANLFFATPATGNIASGQSVNINIVEPAVGIGVGVNTAKLTLSFSDGTTRTVSLLLVVTPGAGGSANPFRDATSCTPTKLLPVFTLLGDIFSVPAAWPTAVESTIVDDCANPMNKGSVVLSFSNGDAPLRLDPSLAGVWSATWPPGNPRASVTLTVTASQPETKLNGTAQISGGVTANPAVPQVSAGGVVETAAYGSPVAPGNLVSIFGAELSSGGSARHFRPPSQ